MSTTQAKKAIDLNAEVRGEDIFARYDSRVVSRLWAYIRPHRWALVAVVVTVALFTIVQVLIPVTVRYAVDSAVGNAQFAFNTILAVFVSLIILNAVSNFFQEWVAARLAQRVIFDLRRAMFNHLQHVSLSILDQTQVGRLMARLQGDVNSLQEFMETSVSAVGDFFLLIGIVAVLLLMDVKLGLLTLCVLPMMFLVRKIWLPWARKAFTRAREASSSVNAALAENINGIRTVQENRREIVNFERYDVRAIENLQAQIGSSRASQVMMPTVDTLTGLAMAIVVVVGGSSVVSGQLDVGVMVAFIFCVQRFFDPIRTLTMQYTVMQRAMASGHRIFEVLDVEVTLSDKEDAQQLADVPPAIEFNHVTFGYRPNQPVLHDLNLHIQPYQTVALVGPTGSGKTSIAALIHRFYDVWDGEVKVGGQDVRDLTLDSLGQCVGMVLQEPFLFSGTIADNMRYGLQWATRAQVIEAAKAVRAHDFIMRLPDGYDTMLGQRGRNLSIGQRQLLSFARALLAKPKILILDEATANIDSFTELEIQRALNVLRKGRTTIIIAHRLATIRDADVIVVLQKGRIVEKGSHDELLLNKGLYAKLHASSNESFDDFVEAEGERVPNS
ncbi:MAG: ABC transporter ATP-binding protein/permease [Burkholderiaceae bacterium]|uniref:ABC transporter ATP-binding protein n=1 Tax=Herminiimonas contaminans TaxID=1111140 RepID=A0ABS0ERC0_9BURK|nr:ABC transporter ATP-binding protein [Herminiimonas contaminans]MBF8177375.1 ABC transporter ATP-binding protein [Herminiimonas contaminans]MBX9799438.1 ABC transporter ATP-binding protein/permease [Burkholderiaceae bacterium]